MIVGLRGLGRGDWIGDMPEDAYRLLPADYLWDCPVSLVTPGKSYPAHSDCHRVGPAPLTPYQVPFITFYEVSLRSPALAAIAPDGLLVAADESPWHSLLTLRIILEAHGFGLAIAASQPGLYPLWNRKYRESLSLRSLHDEHAAPDVTYVTPVDPATISTVSQQLASFQRWYQQNAPEWEASRQERAANAQRGVTDRP
jgi:hypothetical protein